MVVVGVVQVGGVRRVGVYVGRVGGRVGFFHVTMVAVRVERVGRVMPGTIMTIRRMRRRMEGLRHGWMK
jgi:hypothetical protein